MHAHSVADRPTARPPPAGCVHVIASVRRFHEWYRHPLVFVSTHWDCSAVTYAASTSFGVNMANGRIAGAVAEAVWCMSVAPLYACEQPAVMLEHVLGDPAVRTEARFFGCAARKRWWWWTSEGLRMPSPTDVVPMEACISTHHKHAWAGAERRSLSRTPTPPGLAAAHVAAWRPAVVAVSLSAARVPPALAASYDADIQAARARLTLWAASRPNVTPRLQDDEGQGSVRCSVVPVWTASGEELALLPSGGGG